MASFKKRTPLVENVRPYIDGVAKNLADKLYGPDGPPWGTKLTEIEDLLLELREVLSEELLNLLLERQAQTVAQQPPAARCCPSCQQALSCEDDNPRIMQTRAGEAQWTEPEGYCTRCRRAFFPSEPSVGA
jgi:hypothetical protein